MFTKIKYYRKRIGFFLILPLFIFPFLSGSNSSWAGNPKNENIRTIRGEEEKAEIDAIITPISPRISDILLLTIIGKQSADYTLEKTVLPEIYGNFEVMDSEYSSGSIKDNIQNSVFRFKLRPQKSGECVLPPIPVKLKKNGSDQTRTLIIPAGKIRVFSDYENTEATLDKINGPFGILKDRTRLFLFGAIGLAFTMGILIFLLRRRKESEIAIKTKVLTPSEKAIEDLELLMKTKIYERDVRTFYIKITGIVRWFIEEISGIRAPEQTTEEFLHELSGQQKRSLHFDESARIHLKDFLEFSDLVKFAKFQPTTDDIFRGYKSARAVVDPPRSSTSEEPEKKGDRP
ncbi:MAG: hypothetical protein Q4G69_07555 [Planctomycetia bacterium]|nr:hypothetical protein [Planctomycetia bacterium]